MDFEEKLFREQSLSNQIQTKKQESQTAIACETMRQETEKIRLEIEKEKLLQERDKFKLELTKSKLDSFPMTILGRILMVLGVGMITSSIALSGVVSQFNSNLVQVIFIAAVVILIGTLVFLKGYFMMNRDETELKEMYKKKMKKF